MEKNGDVCFKKAVPERCHSMIWHQPSFFLKIHMIVAYDGDDTARVRWLLKVDIPSQR